MYFYILVLSFIGFIITYHIWHKKIRKEKLFCVIGKDCNKVIESEHAETFGIENAVLGMSYYAFIIFASLITIAYPSILSFSYFIIIFLIISGLAALFSLYLLGIQLLVLKRFCEYCLTSTAIVISIFIILVI